MAQIFKNNVWGQLASELASGATTATLSAGHGFTDPGTDWYLATLIGVTGTTETAWEIVKVTDVSTNTLTIVRAQEGTTAVTWPVGTRIELRLTAGATESKANLGAAAYKTVGTGSSDVAAGDHAHASLYQPLDSDLTALAGLSTTGLIERTGAGAAAIVTVTAAGKALLDDNDAAAQRTTLGLGTAATMTGPSGTIVGTTDEQTLTSKTLSNPTISNGYKEQIGTSPPSTLNPDNGSIQAFTLTASIDWTGDDELEAGESILLMINDGSAYAIAWPTMTWVGGTAPTLDTTKYTCVELWKVGTTLYGASVGAA